MEAKIQIQVKTATKNQKIIFAVYVEKSFLITATSVPNVELKS